MLPAVTPVLDLGGTTGSGQGAWHAVAHQQAREGAARHRAAAGKAAGNICPPVPATPHGAQLRAGVRGDGGGACHPGAAPRHRNPPPPPPPPPSPGLPCFPPPSHLHIKHCAQHGNLALYLIVGDIGVNVYASVPSNIDAGNPRSGAGKLADVQQVVLLEHFSTWARNQHHPFLLSPLLGPAVQAPQSYGAHPGQLYWAGPVPVCSILIPTHRRSCCTAPLHGQPRMAMLMKLTKRRRGTERDRAVCQDSLWRHCSPSLPADPVAAELPRQKVSSEEPCYQSRHTACRTVARKILIEQPLVLSGAVHTPAIAAAGGRRVGAFSNSSNFGGLY